MGNIFELAFTFREQTYKFQITAQDWGDGKRYAVNVDDTGLLYQPDAGGKFGYVIVPGQLVKDKAPDLELLAAIGKEFDALQKHP